MFLFMVFRMKTKKLILLIQLILSDLKNLKQNPFISLL